MTIELHDIVRRAFDEIIDAAGDLGPCPTTDRQSHAVDGQRDEMSEGADHLDARADRSSSRPRVWGGIAAGLLLIIGLGSIAFVMGRSNTTTPSDAAPTSQAAQVSTSTLTNQIAPTESVAATSGGAPMRPLQCDADLDQIVTLLQSGQFPIDYEGVADFNELVQLSDLVLTGTIESFVREVSTDSETGEQIAVRSSDSRVVKSDTTDQLDVPGFSFPTAWANRPADPLAEPVLVEDVDFVALLHRSNADPNAFVVDRLQIVCTNSTAPTVAIVGPLPAHATGLSLDELVAAAA